MDVERVATHEDLVVVGADWHELKPSTLLLCTHFSVHIKVYQFPKKVFNHPTKLHTFRTH